MTTAPDPTTIPDPGRDRAARLFARRLARLEERLTAAQRSADLYEEHAEGIRAELGIELWSFLRAERLAKLAALRAELEEMRKWTPW